MDTNVPRRFIGGPLDGEVIGVRSGVQIVRVPIAEPLTLTAGRRAMSKPSPTYRYYEYERIRPRTGELYYRCIRPLEG